MTPLVVAINSTPIAQPRARHVAGRPLPVSTADKRVKAYRKHLVEAMRRAVKRAGWEAPDGPVGVTWKGYFPTRQRKRWWTWHGVKPDRDNVDKLVLDCAQEAGVLAKGDQKVATGELSKVWVPPGSEGLFIWFEPLGEGPAPEDPEDDLGAVQSP